MRNAHAGESVGERSRMRRGVASVWLLLLVLPMVGLLVGFLGGAVASYVMPRKFESTGVVQVTPATGAEAVMISGDAVTQVSRGQFLATEIEVIQARETLERAVRALDLAARWNLTPDECVAELQGILTVGQLRQTDLLAIRVRHPNAEDARDVAEQVMTQYQSRRNEEEAARSRKVLDALDAELRKQEDVVEEKRKVLDTIVEAVGLPVFTAEEGNELEREIAAVHDAAARNYHELDRERESLEIQVKELGDLSGEELLGYAAGLQLPGNGALVLYDEYRVELGKLNDLLDGGMGDAHPHVVAQRVRVDVLKTDLDRAVAVLREILQTQKNLVDARLEKMKQVMSGRRAASFDRGAEQDYLSAKRDYEEAMAVSQHRKLAGSERRIMAAIPKNPVTIHEKPRLGRNPVTPNVTLCLAGGALGGAALGVVLALMIGLAGKVTGRSS